MKKASKYSVIRCDRSGVFFGIIGELSGPVGQTATITDVRNLHYWDGAASLLQLAHEGVKRPDACSFTMTVPSITVTDVIQIVPCTPAAEACIKAVKDWKQ
jgi:hypothetical protein